MTQDRGPADKKFREDLAQELKAVAERLTSADSRTVQRPHFVRLVYAASDVRKFGNRLDALVEEEDVRLHREWAETDPRGWGVARAEYLAATGRDIGESPTEGSGGAASTTLLTPDLARRLRCWACGERATAIYFLIEGDRAVSVEGSCDDPRHDLLRQWDVAARERDPLVDEVERRFPGQHPSGFILVSELLDSEEAADWEQHLRSKVWGKDAITLLRAVGRS